MSRAANRVVDILSVLYHKDELSLTEITSILNIPKTSVYDILSALEKRGIVERANPKLKTYRLGMELFKLGQRALSRVGIVDAARPELERLAAASGETAYLAIESGDSILYLDKVESTRPVAPTHNIGDTNSLYATALGKALLASRTDDEVRQKLDGVMEPITDNTIVSVDELIEDMAATRKRGYAIDDRESCDFMVCVAAPVLDASGSAIAAISVAMINYQKCDIEDIAFNVVKSARSISKKQGFFGDALYGA